MLLWLPYFILCFPGNMAWDTGGSILFQLGLTQSKTAQNNPYFQNLLFGSFAFLGRLLGNIRIGVFLYCLIQYLLECVIIGKLLYFLKNKWKIHNIVMVFLILLYGLMPVFPVFGITMGKDSNFGLALLFYLYFSFRMIDDPVCFFSDRRSRIAWTFTLIIIALLRNHAAAIALIGPWIFVLLRRNRRNRLYRFLIIPTIGTILVSSVIPAVCGIPSPQKKEDLSIPLQTTAVFVLQYPNDVTEEEKAVIESVIPLNDMKDYYPGYADPIKKKASVTNKNYLPFLKIWAKLMLKHPSALVVGLYREAWGYFDPFHLTGIKTHVQLGFSISQEAKEKLQLSDLNSAGLLTVKNLDNASLKIPILGMLGKIGIYSILLLVSFILSLKKREFLLCTVPFLLILAGCILSPVNGYYRYSYPYILAVPFLFTGLLCKRKKEVISASEKEAP